MTGIIRSSTARSYGAELTSISSAAVPPSAVSTSAPHCRSRPASTSRLVGLSSTASTRTPSSRGSSGSCRSATTSSDSSNQNVLPTPGSVSTPMSPSMRATSCRAVARPRPAPPYWRVLEESPWEKASKSPARTESVIPIPVSLTSNRSPARPWASPTSRTRRVISPAEVNFTALLARLKRICRIRAPSPRTTSGSRGSHSVTISSRLACAEGATRSAVSSTTSTTADLALLELDALVGDLGEVEDVVDQVEQHAPGAVHALGVLPLAFVEVGLHQQLGEADDTVHRGPDLVAHGGEEIRLRPRGLQRRVARGLEVVLSALLGAQQSGGAGEREQQEHDGADDQRPQGHRSAAQEVDDGEPRDDEQRPQRDHQGEDRPRSAVSGWLPGRAPAVEAGHQDRAQHPAGVLPVLVGVAEGQREETDVGDQPRRHTDAEPGIHPLAGPPVGDHAQHEGEQDRVGDRVRRPHQLDERSERRVTRDRGDREAPQRHHADRDDGGGVDEGVDVAGLPGPRPDQGHHESGDEEDVGDQPADVGERGVGELAVDHERVPDDLTEGVAGESVGDQTCRQLSLGSRGPAADPGHESRAGLDADEGDRHPQVGGPDDVDHHRDDPDRRHEGSPQPPTRHTRRSSQGHGGHGELPGGFPSRADSCLRSAPRRAFDLLLPGRACARRLPRLPV